MISLSVRYVGSARAVVVELQGNIKNLSGLNLVLANRWADEMKAHFRKKNATPNKLGGKRTNFWNSIADDTSVTGIREDGATLTVANQEFNIHLFGGKIVPKKAKALTIPLVPEAHGLLARSYERQFGRKLFTIGGKAAGSKVPFLFERTGSGDRSVTGDTNVRIRTRDNKPKTVRLAARSEIRPVYRLAPFVIIKRDPTALPDRAVIERALMEEGGDWIERELAKGGALS